MNNINNSSLEDVMAKNKIANKQINTAGKVIQNNNQQIDINGMKLNMDKEVLTNNNY
jgi:hypothetical protein